MELTVNVKRKSFPQLLMGKDLRRLRSTHKAVNAVYNQETFDELFGLVLHHERPLVMRAVDAVEKITLDHPEYLQPHKAQLKAIMSTADHKELKWHIAQLITRVPLTQEELIDVWNTLSYWARNRSESKIVRVNALQGLYDLSKEHPEFANEYNTLCSSMEHEHIPSIQARIRKLKKGKTPAL
jgi:hypothetical protein